MKTKSRRSPGEGSIRLRADGRYEATLDIGYWSGKRRRKSFYGRTKREVQQKLRKAQQELDAGHLPPNELLTLARFLEYWLKTYVKPHKRPLTYSSYESIVRLHLVPELGRIRVSRLNASDVNRFLAAKVADEELSSRRVQQMREVLRNALNKAQKEKLVTHNAAAEAEPITARRVIPEPFDKTEAMAFVEAAKGHPLRAMFLIALSMGLRLGEVCGLRWADIDLTIGTLTVNYQLQRVPHHGLQLVEPKTEQSKQPLNLTALAWDALREHRVKEIQQGRLNAFVFTSKRGNPLDPSTARRSFKKLLRETNQRDQRVHDLRHACASLLAHDNVPAPAIQQMLRHARLDTTRAYIHAVQEAQALAAKRMDAILGKTA